LLKNWDKKDIKMKELLDYGFPLPQYEFNGKSNLSIEYFYSGGLQAVAYGKNPLYNSETAKFI
jgi:hypothetical protein